MLFLFLFINCKSETKSHLENNIDDNHALYEKDLSAQDSLINFIDKNFIRTKIIDNKKIEDLKLVYKNSLERDIERPYIWDVFVSSNDTLLEFYNYEKEFVLNETKFKPYYIKIDYEDANYEGLMLINESSNNLYNSIIVYENLQSEENYSRITELKSNDILNLKFSIGNLNNRKQLFQLKNGLFLDYFESKIIDKQWNNNEYQLKGETKDGLKNGYWIEKKYSIMYSKIIIEDGNYKDGLKDGEWNYSPEGPVDKIEVFENGKLKSTYYP